MRLVGYRGLTSLQMPTGYWCFFLIFCKLLPDDGSLNSKSYHWRRILKSLLAAILRLHSVPYNTTGWIWIKLREFYEQLHALPSNYSDTEESLSHDRSQKFNRRL